MLGALYVGMSGMQAFSNGLKTISTNVANLTTPGYKSSTISFSELYARGGGGLTYMTGQSTGNGVRYNPERIDFSQGTLQQTGGDLDLSIQGNSFLAVQNDAGDLYYIRTGQFSVDSKGYITTPGGERLMIIGASNRPQALNLTAHMSSVPVATKDISFSQNLSSSSTTANVSNIAVYDSNGASQVWNVKFDKSSATTGTAIEWKVTVQDQAGTTLGTGTLSFNGGIISPTTNTLTIDTTPTGASSLSVKLDFSTVTSFSSGSTSTIQASKVDGHAMGTLNTVTINDKGEVVLNYTNAEKLVLGPVAIADFQNRDQLERNGNGQFRFTGDGQVAYRASGVGGVGTLQTKQIEASNVDLTSEFGNLILIQRGYSASSQVISASNDMIQQLFGMKGRG